MAAARIWFDGKYAHMAYLGNHYHLDFEKMLRIAATNDGYWESFYAGRILKKTRAGGYRSIHQLRLKVLYRPLEDFGSPQMYENDKPSADLQRLDWEKRSDRIHGISCRRVLKVF